jgi:glycolate oxidase FAD binding subunit
MAAQPGQGFPARREGGVTALDSAAYAPADEAEAGRIVREARARGERLDIVGGGARLGLGRPAEGARRLSTSRLAGIVFHEPAEMTLRAKAGTPLAVVEAALAAHGQTLPFEPIDHRALYGGAGEPTVGGLVATNASGPRRVSAGAARDSLIGLRLVNGRGEAIESGGRVMKNVAGLDLVKLNCGALGTLGLVAEATFKLLPKPQSEATIVLRRLDDEAGVAAMTRALASPYGVSGAAWIGPGMGREFSRAILRVEGFSDSVDYRAERLIALNADLGAKHALSGEDSQSLWRAVRDAEFLAEPPNRAIWRVSLQPSKAPPFIARLGTEALAHFFDWGGGLVWLASEPTEGAAVRLRAALAPLGGHATLIRAPDALRARVDVFEPLNPALARLTRGVKASFDPDALFNFGRMYAGM